MQGSGVGETVSPPRLSLWSVLSNSVKGRLFLKVMCNLSINCKELMNSENIKVRDIQDCYR